MREQALLDRRIDTSKIEIVGAPDFSDDADRRTYLTETYSFDAVMSGNAWVRDIVHATTTLVLDEQERLPIHATHIREWIMHDDREQVKRRCTP